MRPVEHAVLQVGSADRRRAFRPQRQLLAPAVLKDVHLLLRDIRRFADSADKERRVFEHRRLDAAVTEDGRQAWGGAAYRLPVGLIFGKDVGTPALKGCSFSTRVT